jgi:hypothetical protein
MGRASRRSTVVLPSQLEQPVVEHRLLEGTLAFRNGQPSFFQVQQSFEAQAYA